MGSHRADAGDDPAREPTGDPSEGPVDLAAVHADDALLDAVHRGHPTGRGRADRAGPDPGHDAELAALLAAWRADVDAAPVPDLVTLDEAVAAVRAGGAAPGKRPRLRRVAVVAAAALAVACVGLGAAVHGAMPGQPLWGVSKVLFASRAASVEQERTARAALEQADAAIRQHDLPAARTLLQGAGTAIGSVRPEDRPPLYSERDRVSSSLSPLPEPPAAATTSPPPPGPNPSTTGPVSAGASATSTAVPVPVLPAPPVVVSSTPPTSTTTSTVGLAPTLPSGTG